MNAAAATFAATFAALYAAHTFGDHWYGQTHQQALGKGARTRQGRLHCLGHVVLLAAHKIGAIAAMWAVTGLQLSLTALTVGLLVDAVSHYWADRRITLQRLAERTGKGDFYRLGADTVNADGKQAFHIGTGAYALDQSWHVAWLFITALIVAAGAA
jgi:hypothetical protein